MKLTIHYDSPDDVWMAAQRLIRHRRKVLQQSLTATNQTSAAKYAIHFGIKLLDDIANYMGGAEFIEVNYSYARAEFKSLGLTISRRKHGERMEYRVNFSGGKEATAYYTDDILDAFLTGEAMARHRQTKVVS